MVGSFPEYWCVTSHGSSAFQGQRNRNTFFFPSPSPDLCYCMTELSDLRLHQLKALPGALVLSVLLKSIHWFSRGAIKAHFAHLLPAINGNTWRVLERFRARLSFQNLIALASHFIDSLRWENKVRIIWRSGPRLSISHGTSLEKVDTRCEYFEVVVCGLGALSRDHPV